MHPPREVLGLLRRHILIRRRSLAALCLGLAVWLTIELLTATPPSGTWVVTAARALDSGTLLTGDDLRRTRFIPGSVPETAVRDPETAIGRTLVAPLAAGEALTDHRLLGRGVFDGYPDRAAIGLRVPDPDAAALLNPGDHVDLVASDPQGEHASVLLVDDAVVLALPEPAQDSPRTDGGRLVLFAVPRTDVTDVAAAGSSLFLTVIWNR